MSDRKLPWWDENSKDMAKSLYKRVTDLVNLNYSSRADNLLYINIATNFNPAGHGSYGYIPGNFNRKIRKNICEAGVSLATSLVTASRTLPTYQTTGAKWSTKKIAEERARVIHSQMIALKAFDLGDQAFVDSAYIGTGVTVGVIEDGVPKLVRALPNSIYVDDSEGQDPRSLYWIHFKPRETLQEFYGIKAIKDSQGPKHNDWNTFCLSSLDKTADLVKVIEAYHLPCGDKAGRHVISTDNVVLVDEAWNIPRFPIGVMRYENRVFGWFGQGLVERLLPAQLKITDLQKLNDRCQQLASNAIVWIEQGSNFSKDQLVNMPVPVYSYVGQKPSLDIWSGTLPDIVNEIERTWQQALEQQGLNPSMAAGGLPQKSLNTGKAVRAADDVISRSMMTCIRRLEQYYLQIAQLIVDLNDIVASNDKNYETTGYSISGRNSFLKSSRWTDLAIDDNDCRLSVLPMSSLPSTIQARLATVTELINQGYLDRPTAIALQGMPDVDSWQDKETAQLDYINWQAEQMLNGEPQTPDERIDPELAKKEIENIRFLNMRSGAPDNIIALFDDYLEFVEQLIPEPTTPDQVMQ